MTNTDKKICLIATNLLASAGITQAVVSPGTRNSPLLTALDAGGFDMYPVVDERSAAFIALGMSRRLRQPVVLVCTSGTAPLNYSPAVAEAYYSSVPLIVITADRPAAFVGNQRAQTIDQRGIYRNFIRYECDVDENDSEEEYVAAINRAIAISDGPVHINMRLNEPLGGLAEAGPCGHVFCTEDSGHRTSRADLDYLSEVLATRRILIIAGPESDCTAGLHIPCELAARSNVAVLTEATSNLRITGAITDVPSAVTAALRLAGRDVLPEYVITCGGTLVSQDVLDRLAGVPGLRHISINATGHPFDPMGCLERAIPFGRGDRPFVCAAAMIAPDAGVSEFSRLWHSAADAAAGKARAVLDTARWCQWKAMDYIFGNIGDSVDVHLSNGMTVRLAQSLAWRHAAWLDCNRGVSGIDGSTSTAIGEALARPGMTTLLLTGDLSFQYDIGALTGSHIPAGFKAVVFNNRGGGIFRFISNTRGMPAREKFLGNIGSVDIAGVARTCGFAYFRACSMEQLGECFSRFMAFPGRAVLEAVTDSDYDNSVFSNYLKSIK